MFICLSQCVILVCVSIPYDTQPQRQIKVHGYCGPGSCKGEQGHRFSVLCTKPLQGDTSSSVFFSLTVLWFFMEVKIPHLFGTYYVIFFIGSTVTLSESS